MEDGTGRRWISSACPGIVSYVERYHPGLVDNLLPVVSPMEADARALHALHGDDLRIVFIGPCIAKKGEADGTRGAGRVEAVMTFVELAELVASRGLTPGAVEPRAFAEPRANLGTVFALSRGMVQAAGMSEDLATGSVVSADGRQDFPEALREFESGDMDAGVLDILCCNGCIMGAGMTTTAPLFRRRARVSRYAHSRQLKNDHAAWSAAMDRLETLDLGRGFAPDDKRMREPSEDEIRQIMRRMGKYDPSDELNCRACGYDSCRRHAVAIFKGLAESEMCLPYVIDQLQHTVSELNWSNRELASTREQLTHSEKLASMGQLAAGIAHEVNNPLGVVLLYAHLLAEQFDTESEAGRDLKLIADQADRCKDIVAGLLDFARQNKVDLKTVDLDDLVGASIVGCLIPPDIALDVEHRSSGLRARLDIDQLGQVIVNLVNNATAPTTGADRVTISTGRRGADSVEIAVTDNGCGIPPENISRIFEPFFTTKEQGQGTGLGLAVSYGIVKMHRGDLQVESNSDRRKGPTGTTFTIILPGERDENPASGPDGT